MTDYISKQDVLNLPQSIERNLRGEIVERSIDVKDVETLKPADVVQVVRCKDCKYSHMTYDGKCKYCEIWFPDEKEYMDGDYYCASAEQR